MAHILALALYVASGGIGFAESVTEDDVATLYRSSPVYKARIHVATYDSSDKKWDGSVFGYNWENCLIAAQLFQSQPGAQVNYWCEKGFYKK